MAHKRKVSGPMVLVASLGSNGRRSRGLADRARGVVGRFGSNGSDGLPGTLERAGELLSAAAVAVAVVARLRSESNGGDD